MRSLRETLNVVVETNVSAWDRVPDTSSAVSMYHINHTRIWYQVRVYWVTVAVIVRIKWVDFAVKTNLSFVFPDDA